MYMYVCVDANLSDCENLSNILWDTPHPTMESVAAEENRENINLYKQNQKTKRKWLNIFKSLVRLLRSSLTDI